MVQSKKLNSSFFKNGLLLQTLNMEGKTFNFLKKEIKEEIKKDQTMKMIKVLERKLALSGKGRGGGTGVLGIRG